MEGRHAVRIRIEESGEELTLIPQALSKHALAGLESLGMETRRSISMSSPPEVFWKCFDEVLAAAAEA